MGSKEEIARAVQQAVEVEPKRSAVLRECKRRNTTMLPEFTVVQHQVIAH